VGDLEYQAAWVASTVPRILHQIDRDPLSPTHGCAHLAYWRDKTSDVADMRRQEAMLTLALLCTGKYPGGDVVDLDSSLAALEALAGFWCRNRYADGSLDEWYKGERAFAAAAFTCHAAARTLLHAESLLSPALRTRMRDCLARTADWLTGRDDLFKTNHQAVGVAALAFAGHVLDEPSLTANAKSKLDSILAVQTKEGWFPEVGNMDVGYTFLTVEFAAMAMHLWQDFSKLGAFARAFDFACQWVHPDLVLGDEYGVCHNPYISRIASVLLSNHLGSAAWLRTSFEERSTKFEGVGPTLADDLRLLRWGYLPLLAWDYAQEMPSQVAPVAVPLARPGHDGIVVFPEAGLMRFDMTGITGVFAPAAGGLVRAFAAGTEATDHGWALSGPEGWATSQAYNRRAVCHVEQGRVGGRFPLSPVKKFMPPYWARVALRLACSSGIGSRLARKAIDYVRRRKGTALNQSSFNLASSDSPWRLERMLRLDDGEVRVIDNLVLRSPVPREDIFLLLGEKGRCTPTALMDLAPELPPRVRKLLVHKKLMPGKGFVPESFEAEGA